MKNILDEKPSELLTGRLRVSVEFVRDEHIIDKEVLDIGCGYGWFELNVLKRGIKKITGIEISENDLATAKKHISDPRVTFATGSAIQLPFPDQSFDTVVSWEVIEHIPKNTEEKMFAEVNRVLKPGGVFYLSTPYNNVWAKIFDPAWWLIGHRHYSKEKLSLFAYNHGFTVEEIQIRGRWWNLLSLLNMYISKWILRRPRLFSNFFARKDDFNFSGEKGFMTIFVKFSKNN